MFDSGIKTFHELNEALPSLVGDDGRIKPFNQFLNEVQKINSNYNVNYLRTEYNLAQASSLMAARWKQFEQDGDRYLLQYRTVGDKRVRRSHRMLHGITLPITSKFWDEYFPPNNFGCRCSAVQVRKGKYPVSDEQEAMKLGMEATAGKYREMFLFNPGKTMTCFPAYNAYTRKACATCRQRPGNMELAANIPDNELCRACEKAQEMARIHAAEEGVRNIIKQLENGYPKGDAVNIGSLSEDIVRFVAEKGIELRTTEIYMTDKQIHHALRTIKQEAGKAVTPEQLISLPSQIGECEVYWDEKAQNIHFITRNGKRIQKFVIAFNYKTKIQGEKVNVNAFITAGNIDERVLKMRTIQRQIDFYTRQKQALQ